MMTVIPALSMLIKSLPALDARMVSCTLTQPAGSRGAYQAVRIIIKQERGCMVVKHLTLEEY
jgi:hypothetical protein